jgi:hypothetical protein
MPCHETADEANLVVAHQSREAWRSLRVKYLDKLRTEVGIHGRKQRPGLYAVLNKRGNEDGGLDTLTWQ